MDADLDPLDAILFDEVVSNAKALRKFQPKTKFKPGRKPAAATSVPTSQAPRTINPVPSGVSKAVIENTSDEGSHVVPEDNGGFHASMGKSAEESSDIFIVSGTLGDFPSHATTDKEGTLLTSETVAVTDSNLENTGIVNLDTSTATGPVFSEGEVVCNINDQELITEEMEFPRSAFSTDSTGLEAGRFQRNSNTMVYEETCKASKSASCSPSPREINHAEKDSSPTFQQDDVLDLSSLGFTNPLADEMISELPSNEEAVNLMETTQLDSGVNLEPVPEVPAKLESRRAKIGSRTTHEPSDTPDQETASTRCQENETGGYSGQRESNQNELVYADHEVLANLEFSMDYPFSSAMEEQNFVAEEVQVENVQTVKVTQKSKHHDENKGPRGRKRKKSEEQQTAKPKKFSHSSKRRKRKISDEALLQTPEDEIDYEKLPLRDLILLGEHREKQTKKDAAAAGTQMRESNEEGGNDDGEADLQNTTAYYNYQTYMDKSRPTRWSKHDTELFYEAIHQFGTNFTMIAQLFPGLDSKQVKRKYKTEERQHPVRLGEALTQRPKDNSYFRKVIDQLQQMAAEKNPNAGKADQMSLTDDDEIDEEVSNAHDEGRKEQQVGQGDNAESKDQHVEQGDKVGASNKVVSREDPDDEEDELLAWMQYKSDEI